MGREIHPWQMVKRMIEMLLVAGVLAYLGGALGVYLYQDHLLYHPDREMTATPTDWELAYQEVTFSAGAGAIHGWWLPPDAGRPVVIFFHGNASNISGEQAHVALFRRLGLGVLLFDYRGYGRSAGTPSEEGLYADALAAWEHLTGPLGVSPRQVVLFGHSLGGGVATWLALRHPPLGLVLESTFTSVPDAGAEVYPYLPVRLLAHNHFPNLQRLPELRTPLLVIHGRTDRVIPFHHGERLFAAAGEPKFFFPMAQGEHHTAFTNSGRDGEEVLRRFLDGLPTP